MKSIKLGYEIETAYWAGFFDGEGSVMITKTFSKDGFHKNPTYQFQAGVATTDKKSMQDLKLFAGVGWLVERRYKKLNQRNSYYWGCKGDKAVIFLQKILPYLRLKKPQALVGIEFQTGKNQPNKSGGKLRPLNPEEIKYRESMRTKIMKLNRKGSNKGQYREL